jgi:hypothetical protein
VLRGKVTDCFVATLLAMTGEFLCKVSEIIKVLLFREGFFDSIGIRFLDCFLSLEVGNLGVGITEAL